MVTLDSTLLSAASSYTLFVSRQKEQKALYKYFAKHNALADFAEHCSYIFMPICVN